jgi:CubicO group peptidase (beta-lactamase class C family)
MTIADLLRHTSGLTGRDDAVLGPEYRRLGLVLPPSIDPNLTLAEMIERLASAPLRVDPGERFIYGISTDVVGYLCEVISGQSFDVFLQERIFGPLGMVDTGFHVPPEKHARFAANYRRGASGEPPLVTVDRPDANSWWTQPRAYFSGAAGLTSTASDYMRFCKMLANGGELDGVRILGPRTVRHMTLNHLPGSRDLVQMGMQPIGETKYEGIGFGLGFAVLLDAAAAGVVGSVGEYNWGGLASTAFFISPADDLIVVFMAQLEPSSTYPLRRELRSIIYGSLTD